MNLEAQDHKFLCETLRKRKSIHTKASSETATFGSNMLNAAHIVLKSGTYRYWCLCPCSGTELILSEDKSSKLYTDSFQPLQRTITREFDILIERYQ